MKLTELFRQLSFFPIIGLTLIVIGIANIITSLQTDAVHQAELPTVQTTQATITGCEPYTVQSGKNGERTLSALFWIDYSFIYNGHTYLNRDSIDIPCNSLVVTDHEAIKVVFVPSDPTQSGFNTDDFLAPKGISPYGSAGIIVGLIFFFAPLYLGLWLRPFFGRRVSAMYPSEENARAMLQKVLADTDVDNRDRILRTLTTSYGREYLKSLVNIYSTDSTSEVRNEVVKIMDLAPAHKEVIQFWRDLALTDPNLRDFANQRLSNLKAPNDLRRF